VKNNILLCYLVLKDEMGGQMFELPGITDADYDYENPYTFKFEIMDVYKGLKWSDVAISHIDIVLCCFAENTTLLSNTEVIPISEITNGNSIITIDINNGVIANTEIVKTAKQTHLSLLKISTISKQIEITPDHPLYIKDCGFMSFNKILKMKGLENYSDLINEIEILTWNTEKKELQYEKLSSVELVKGVFHTYGILELKKGSTFIANGFVNKVY